MTLKTVFLTLLLAATPDAFGQQTPPKPTAPAPSQPITTGLRVVSCGHSFHPYVPAMLAELAASAGIKDHKILAVSIIGGSKSIQHWNVPDEKNKAKAALRDGDADVLTLTPVYLPDDGIEKFAQFGLEHNPNLRITVQEFWLPYDKNEPHYYDPPKIPAPKVVDHNGATMEKLRAEHESYFKSMDAQVRDVNRKVGKQAVFVVPVGQAVLALREKIIAGQAPGLKAQDDLFTDALGHPKPPLQALVTYCHYCVIYRKNPAGLAAPKVRARQAVGRPRR